MGSFGAGVLSTAGSIISGAANDLFAQGSQRRQFNYNLALQKQQQDWQKMMWELQNNYNLPKNEIQRLLDAGVNPSLAFSNGGASAAPVPQSGSAGGVSAPFGDMPNVGSSTVQAVQDAQRIENETKVSDSQVELNNARADEARANAGLTGEEARSARVRAELDEKLKPVFARLGELRGLIGEIKLHLAGNARDRDDIYTNSFGRENAARVRGIELNNDLLRRDYDRLNAEIDLLVAKKRLTDDEARNVRLQGDILFTERYYAQWNYNFTRIINRNVYGSADSPDEGSLGVQEVIAKSRKEVSNALFDAAVRERTLANDYGFELNYGLGSRFYSGYEGPRRSANATRAGIYTSFISSLSGAASMAISAGSASSSIRLRNAMTKSLKSTNKSFGVNSPYGSFFDATTPSYHGGTEYYPF